MIIQTKTSLFKSNLLIVDDKPENLIALKAVLGSEYNLWPANSGQEALEVLEKQEVDVILLDIQMPEMDGYETARRIKQIEKCKNIPIIFVTAIFKEDPHIKKGYEVGAIDYFTKPFDPDILKLKIAIYSSFRKQGVLLKERERQIQESEELLKAGRKLSAVLQTLPVGVIIADIDGRILQINDAVLRISKSVEPLANDSYGEFIKWWAHEGHVIKDAFSRALTSGESKHNEILKIACFDGAQKVILSSSSPLRGLNDQIVGAVAVIQDITQHRQIEEDMEQRIMKLISIGVELEQTAH
jgi:PAS domain S-box-containing protein